MGTHWSTYVILALFAVVIVSGLVLTLRDEEGAKNTVGIGYTMQPSRANPNPSR
jgi:hypothetical protein